jgi:aryl-alcohol dehydrogenase-like predicted oxidoreductase
MTAHCAPTHRGRRSYHQAQAGQSYCTYEFPRFSSENIAANMPIVDFLRQFSEKKNATPVQISLAWLLELKPFIVPIPGTRSVDHLRENLRAVDVQLRPADLREIETALSKIEVHGGRMNEERMNAVDQTT